MRFLKRMNTVFYRLVFSYFLLIIITTIFMGITSYVYFSKNFNEEIEKVNSRMLSYVKKITDENIFRETESIYIDIILPQSKDQVVLSLFNEPLVGNHAAIYQVSKYLKEIASVNSELVESIAVYYRQNNLIISSQQGVEYLDEASGDSEVGWLHEVNTHFKDVLAWYHFDGHVALVGSYPYTHTGDSQGYVAIQLKDSAIADLLTDSAGDTSGALLVLEPGSVVGQGLGDSELKLSRADIDDIMQSPADEHYYLTEVAEIKSMISYTTLDTTGWRLVNITPVDQFYEKSETVQRAILLICVIALVIGAIISNVFTANLYNPLRSIIDSVRKLFYDESNQTRHENEYKMINHVIDNLSVKVSDLEQTLTTNVPLIRNKLVEDLLKGKLSSVEKMNERLSLVQLTPIDHFNFYTVITLKFDESFMDNINTENSEFIKYNLLDQIERELSFDGMCLAIEDEHQIHMLVCVKHKNQDAVYSLVNDLMTYAYSNFMVSMVAAIGTWTFDPLKISAVYAETERILKYQYFKPKLKVLAGRAYTDREQSKKELDDSYLEQFTKALKQKDEAKAESAVKAFVEELSEGPYNADYAHDRIKELIYQYYSYVKSMNASTRDILSEDLLADFYEFTHIDQLKGWLLEVVKVTFDYIEDKQKNRSSELIDKIKTYIKDHLHEDLSLNAVADVVYLSPRYLSRVFKQETGENFVDFVTKARMERAGELLRTSEMNIEQIAQTVSYNNPAYFTKKFKEVYGMTPSQYRSQG